MEKILKYTTESIPTILNEFKLNPDKGLTTTQIEQSRKTYGENKIKKTYTTGWYIFIRQFQSSFIYLLIFAVLISWLLGEVTNALFIIAFIVINVIFGFYHEYRSEQTLKLLTQYVKNPIRVKRNGTITAIDSENLVIGDLVIIEAGDIIPADIRFIKTHNLAIDESTLTGESLEVTKNEKPLQQEATQPFMAKNIGFSGTHVLSGEGEGIVMAIGITTQFGKIAKLTQSTKRESVFEKELSKISTFVLKLVGITLIAVFTLNLAVKGQETNLINLLIFSIALAVSVIPEALPVVATFSLSKGALQLAKNKVVVKRLSSIEDFGAIEVLCTDKTGTLTENKLEITDLLSEDEDSILKYASLAGSHFSKQEKVTDSFDIAIEKRIPEKQKRECEKYTIIDEMPFDPDRKISSSLIEKNGKQELIIRGASEKVFSSIEKLNNKEIKKLETWIQERSVEGKRVIAIAYKNVKGKNTYNEKDELKGFSLLGLIAFLDPIKETAAKTIENAKRLGIDIKILTGDGKEISGAVAYKTGLIDDPKKYITGDEIDKLNDGDLIKACLEYNVFARVSPEQKFKIIQALKTVKEVGYLGDGINDAPALKEANIGIVVKGASAIAQETADIILLKKSLRVLIEGVGEGRKVFTNITKYIRVTLASNFGNFYAVAISTLFIKYLPMLPIQILLLNLLSDFPMIAISDDTVDTDELRYPSKNNIRDFAILASVLGAVSTIFDLTFFTVFKGRGESSLQTYWFIGSALTELAFIYSIRTKKWFFQAIKPPVTIIVITLLAAVLVVFIPFAQIGSNIFKFIKPTCHDVGIVIVITLIYFVTTEIVKKVYFRRVKPKYS